MAKNSPAKTRDAGLIPGLGRSPGEENGNPLQYSCLGNPMNRGAWWATVYGVAKGSDTTEQLNSSNKASVTTYHKLRALNQHKFILGQSGGQKTKVGHTGLKSRCQQGTLLPGLVTSRSCAGCRHLHLPACFSHVLTRGEGKIKIQGGPHWAQEEGRGDTSTGTIEPYAVLSHSVMSHSLRPHGL